MTFDLFNWDFLNMLSRAQIKTIRSLRHKKYRQKFGRFIAEGVKVVDELLKSDIRVEKIFALENRVNVFSLAEARSKPELVSVTEKELKQISSLETPQQVLAVCIIPSERAEPLLTGKVSLMLEAVRDPGNLGTIIRIADWFGIENVICSPDCVDVFNPKVVQATMGSVARVKVSAHDLSTIIGNNKTLPLYAATLNGKDIASFPKIGEGLLLLGNESHGLSENLLAQSDHKITIPRIGKAESLNVAVAAGIICSRLAPNP